MASRELSVRVANVADADKLVELHYDSVHENARDDYPSDVLDSWSPQPNEQRYAWMRSQIEAEDNQVLVAEAGSGSIDGFCMFSPSEGYSVVEPTTQSLFDGSQMECYAMCKDLPC